MRLSTTARIGLMAVALALVAGWVPVAFLWHSTHDDAIGVLRRDTLECSRILSAAIARDGRRALDDAVGQARSVRDSSLIVALVDDDGRQLGATHTGTAGAYELPVPPAPCLLVCAASDHVPHARRAAPGRIDVELEPRPAPVVGT